jgi:hypothetical protein
VSEALDRFDEPRAQALLDRLLAVATVDMLLSGGMLGSVKVVERSDTGVVIGLGTGTSRVVRPPAQKRRRQKAKKLGRGPAHNLLGQWHQDGDGNNPAREWFGVSPRGDAAIRRQMVKRKPRLKVR